MSWYRFIASDMLLDEFCVGIEVLNKNVIVIEDEFGTLNIFRDDDCVYSGEYTKLPHVMGVEYVRYGNIKDSFCDYMEKQLEKCKVIEIWSTWLDEETKEPERRSVKSDELTQEDLEWICGQEYYTHPQCLKIYMWTKGKR